MAKLERWKSSNVGEHVEQMEIPHIVSEYVKSATLGKDVVVS